MPIFKRNQMKTFIQWNSMHPSAGPELATDSRSTKTSRNRDRLARMESLLHELIKVKEIISRSAANGQG
jgi:hypothetical protein